MTASRSPARRAVAVVVLLSAMVFVRCGDLFVDPAGARPIGLSLLLAASAAAGGSAEAFDSADRIAVRLRAGQDVVHSTEQAFSAAGGDVQLSVAAPAIVAGTTVTIEVELLQAQSLLFVGQGTVTPEQGGDNAAEIVLQPVAAAVLIEPASVTFDAFGARATLRAAAVFATGDSIDGAAITFRSLAPTIVQIEGAATALSVGNGSTTLEAAFGDRTASANATVEQRVTDIQVSQAGATVAAGATFTFTVALSDRNGFPVAGRTVQWTSSNPAILQIDANGVARALGTGTVTVTGVVDAAQTSFTIRVSNPAPVAPSGLTGRAQGTIVSLRWQDNATDETSYQVLVRPGSGAAGAFAVAATVGPNVTSFGGDSRQVDAQLEYAVRSCNAAGCSDSSPSVVIVTVPTDPSGVGVTYDCSTGRITLNWNDNSTWEDRFVIELDEGNGYYVADEVGPNETSYDISTRYYAYQFRISACNAAGCGSDESSLGQPDACPSPLMEPPALLHED